MFKTHVLEANHVTKLKLKTAKIIFVYCSRILYQHSFSMLCW